jgi:hypothetical protein
VDVWLDETLLLDDFSFRSASPFTYLTAGQEVTLAIKGPDSQDPGDPLWSKTFNLEIDDTYVMVASGIISSTGYDPVTPFDVYVYQGAREMALNGSNTDILAFHGATDAPVVDIVEIGAGAGTIVDNLSYGIFDGYHALATANYSLDVRDESGTTTVGNFDAPLSDLNLDGRALTLLASGFLDPENNSNGEEFGLLAVMSDGTSIMLTNTTGMKDPQLDISSLNVFPNPAFTGITIAYELKEPGRLILEVMDVTGRLVRSVELGRQRPGIYEEKINVEGLTGGLYLLNVRTDKEVISKKLLVQ